jgi:hypothetical protein
MAFCAATESPMGAPIKIPAHTTIKAGRKNLAAELTMLIVHFFSVERPNYPKPQLRFGAAVLRRATKTQCRRLKRQAPE